MVSNLIIRSTEYGVFAYEPDGRQNFDAQYETPVFDQALANAYTSEEMNGWQDMQVVLPDIYLIYRDIELFDGNNPIVILYGIMVLDIQRKLNIIKLKKAIS